MKKIIALALCLCTLICLVACGTTQTPDQTQTPAPSQSEAAEAEYKLGMGIVVNMDSSKTGNAQVDATAAAVVVDKDGKIVSCRIDVAQNKMDITDGAVETEKEFKTKMELGDDYNMAKYGTPNVEGGTVQEWYVQTKAFEEYVVGKTADEVKTIELQEVNAHKIAVDEALLSAGCTMQITEFMDAVVKACNDEQGTTFKTAETFTLGIAANTAVDAATVAASDEGDGTVAMYSDFACAVVVGGKVVATLNDAIQPKITISKTGDIVETAFVATKRELKEDYNMAKYGTPNVEGGTVKEWYIQSAAFSAHVVGMTADEIKGMETKEANGHLIPTDEALLSAGCTMQITGICDVVAKAAANAR